MANTNVPFGFRWHGLYGDPVTPSVGLVQMKIAAGDGSQYGENDPLKFLSTGYVTAFTKGTGVSQLAGIFKSCEYYNTTLGRRVWSNYWPGSGATGDVIVSVLPCMPGVPSPRFLVQSSGASAITTSSVWNNVDIASGTATTGTVTGGFYRSACTIDTLANITTTATLPWRIVQIYTDIAAPGSPGSDNTTQYNWVLVQANNSQATGI